MISAGEKLLKKTDLKQYRVKSFRVDGSARFITVEQVNNTSLVETLEEGEIPERFYVELKEHEDELIKRNQKAKNKKNKKARAVDFPISEVYKGVN